MTRRPLLLRLLILSGVLLVAPIALLTLQTARTDPRASPQSSVASVEETQVARPVTEIEQAVWWRIGWRELDDPSAPDFERLTVGLVDGDVFGHVRIGRGGLAQPGSGPPFVVGPRMGMVLFGMRDGDGAELHLFEAATRRERLLVSSPSLLYHAALAPASGCAYFATGPGDPGIWRVGLGGDDPPQLVAEPPEVIGVHSDAVLTAPVAGLPKQVTLLVDDAEERLAVLTCTDLCLLRIFDLRTDTELVIGDLDPGSRVLTDFVDGVVVIDGVSAFDVEAGRAVPPPDTVRSGIEYDVGWEVPPGWRIEERMIGMGPTQFVLIDPDGNETPIDVMGQGVGNG